MPNVAIKYGAINVNKLFELLRCKIIKLKMISALTLFGMTFAVKSLIRVYHFGDYVYSA